jgi:hypothetical protein
MPIRFRYFPARDLQANETGRPESDDAGTRHAELGVVQNEGDLD